VYKDQVYLLDEDGYAAAESNDLIRKRFVKASDPTILPLSEYSLFGQAWEALMSGPKSTFTEGNYRTFFGMAIEMLVKPWEKMLGIMKFTEVRVCHFFDNKVYSDILSQLGAVRLDRDIRAVVGYLSSQATFGNAREKFQRLFQVSTLLNLDAVSIWWYYRMRG
jgi:conserved oligomeric Golgi complex subunit 4